MADNLNLRGKPDRDRINLGERWEVGYWTTHFGVTEAKLREAVDAVGVMVADVREYLGK